MSISKEQILAKRKRLEIQKAKDEAKSQAIRLRLKKAAQKLVALSKQVENEKKMVLGGFYLNKANTDPNFRTVLEAEIAASQLGDYEKSLFAVSKETTAK